MKTKKDYCSHASRGHQTYSSHKFCAYCGARMTKLAVNVCSYCGERNLQSGVYCTKCGEKL